MREGGGHKSFHGIPLVLQFHALPTKVFSFKYTVKLRTHQWISAPHVDSQWSQEVDKMSHLPMRKQACSVKSVTRSISTRTVWDHILPSLERTLLSRAPLSVQWIRHQMDDPWRFSAKLKGRELAVPFGEETAGKWKNRLERWCV